MLEIYFDVRDPYTIAQSPFLALDKHYVELSQEHCQFAATHTIRRQLTGPRVDFRSQ